LIRKENAEINFMQFISKSVSTFLLIISSFFISYTYGQVGVDLNDYVLDTILKPSAHDPTIMDTIITAKKKVVIKKEVIVENEIFIDPFLSNKSIHIYASPNWFKVKDLYTQGSNYNIRYLQPTGSIIGAEFQTNVDYRVRLSVGLALSNTIVNAEYNSYNYKYIETNKIVSDTLETYFIGSNPYYILETKTVVNTDSLLKTNTVNFTNSFKTIHLEFALGKEFELDYYKLYPRISIGYEQFTYVQGLKNNNGSLEGFIPPYSKYNGYEIAFSCGLTIPIMNNFGLNFTPTISYLKNIYTSSTASICTVYSIRSGFYYIL